MTKLTKQEHAWVKKLQQVLDECPSRRMAAFTVGDPNLYLYDCNFDDRIAEIQDKENKEFGRAVEKLGVGLGELQMPFSVHSTCG
ncbi:MAG: hypothetical protein C9356_15220 [Oleiphilus sp.]|nr:MAG: hypothetical protein C9356_15220 [Oleiphilus sp.]